MKLAMKRKITKCLKSQLMLSKSSCTSLVEKTNFRENRLEDWLVKLYKMLPQQYIVASIASKELT